MTTDVTTTTIDYGAFVQVLKDRCDQLTEQYGRILLWHDYRYIREFRTVGFRAPRQSGRSIWAMNEVAQKPNVMLVAPNTAIRNELVMRQVRGEEATGRYPIVKVQLEDIDRRVVTWLDLRAMMGERGATGETPGVKVFELPEGIDTIILDDAEIIFRNIRQGKFFRWVSEYFSGQNNPKPYVILLN